MPTVHLLNRSSRPPMIACGKSVSRPSQYSDDLARATCRACADSLPGLTPDQRAHVHENWDEAHHRSTFPGNKPQATRVWRYPLAWEKCHCGRMSSRNWDAWMRDVGTKGELKSLRTLHAPERHGGCGPMPPKERRPRVQRAAKVGTSPAPSNVVPIRPKACPF